MWGYWRAGRLTASAGSAAGWAPCKPWVTLETVLAKAGKKAPERNLYFLLSHLSFTAERTRTFLLTLPSLSETYSHFNQLHFPYCSLKKSLLLLNN